MKASTTVETSGLDKMQFIARANKICRLDQRELRQDFADFKAEQNPSVSKARTFAEASKSFLIPRIQFQFDYILALGGPSGEERQVEEMLGAMQFAIETGQGERVTSASQLSRLFEDFNQLAYEYGVDECPVDRMRYPWLWLGGR